MKKICCITLFLCSTSIVWASEEQKKPALEHHTSLFYFQKIIPLLAQKDLGLWAASIHRDAIFNLACCISEGTVLESKSIDPLHYVGFIDKKNQLSDRIKSFCALPDNFVLVTSTK